MSERVPHKLGPGAMVGGYRIERQLGQGGVGTVYAAEEPTIKKRVAIKVLRRALVEDEGMALRFEREARAVNEIRHPGIVDVFAMGVLEDGRPYLVMSLLEGESLRDALQRRGRLGLAEAWRIARETAEALAAAHDAGVVHRDLKPDNVFLERVAARRPDGAERPPRVRVLDFGIAKVEAAEPGVDPVKLTGTGVPLGTPAYMAPEQWWAAGITARTDQYALGAMLFEMLSGRPPFSSPRFADLVQLHVNQPPPALAEVGVAAPAPVEALVARLLAKAADDRFASMSAVVEAGDLAFVGAAPEPSEEGPAAPPTAPILAAAGTAAVPASTAPAPEGAPALAELVPEATPDPPALRRYLTLHAAILLLGFLGVIAVGYGGVERHDVIEWISIGGWGQWLVVLWYPVAAVALATLARRRAATGVASNAGFWIALAPALQGALTTYTGWRIILRAMPSSPTQNQLVLFNQGTYEANSARFFGFSVGALLFLSAAALPGVSGMASPSSTLMGALGVRRREAAVAAVGLGGIAAWAAFAGAPSGALIAGVAAVAVAVSALLPTVHAETAARDELERAAAGILAVGLAVAAGITRIEAQEASLWASTATRAARVAGILAAQAERDATVPIAVASLLVLAGVEGLRLARVPPLGALTHPRPGTALLAAALVLGVAGDFVQHGRFADKRAELRAALGAQFALFARLDPPPGDALDAGAFPPHQATGLQITRDVIALEGRGVARLATLDTAEGASHVAAELDRALAQATLEQRTTDGIDLSVSIDREVDGAAVMRVLKLARGAGARRIEVLLTRGESPALGRGGPPEIDVVVPGDFVALPVELSDTGVALPAGQPFGSLTPSLVVQALAAHGPIALSAPAPTR